MESGIIGSLQRDQKVPYLGTDPSKQWILVDLGNGQTGYVSADWVRIESPTEQLAPDLEERIGAAVSEQLAPLEAELGRRIDALTTQLGEVSARAQSSHEEHGKPAVVSLSDPVNVSVKRVPLLKDTATLVTIFGIFVALIGGIGAWRGVRASLEQLAQMQVDSRQRENQQRANLDVSIPELRRAQNDVREFVLDTKFRNTGVHPARTPRVEVSLHHDGFRTPTKKLTTGQMETIPGDRTGSCEVPCTFALTEPQTGFLVRVGYEDPVLDRGFSNESRFVWAGRSGGRNEDFTLSRVSDEAEDPS